jgi:hypothetical protein
MEARVRDTHARRVAWASLLRPRGRNGSESLYQVSYETTDGDGRVKLRSQGAPTASLATRAADLLEQRGISGRIRWIAPLGQGAGDPSSRRRG